MYSAEGKGLRVPMDLFDLRTTGFDWLIFLNFIKYTRCFRYTLYTLLSLLFHIKGLNTGTKFVLS